jgi:hypothetical protein
VAFRGETVATQPDILEDFVVERAEHDVSAAVKTPLVKGGQHLPAETGNQASRNGCRPRHGHDHDGHWKSPDILRSH